MGETLAFFAAGAVFMALIQWRTWRDFILDLRWHGRDNHLCGRIECHTCGYR